MLPFGAHVRLVLHALGGAAILFSLAVQTARPQEMSADDTELGPVFLMSLGGKLYDDVWRVLDSEPPQERNPAVAAGSGIAFRETWRCVTCHGWSYSGAKVGDQAFPGLRQLAGTDPDHIRARLLDPRHPFPADRMPDLALDLLAFFIRDGFYARGDFLDEEARALGDPERGQAIYEGACINCHQLDGRRYLRGERGDRSSLGWVMRERPEQALHKILNGVPGAEMLSLRFMPADQISDLVAYVQTLP